MKPEKEIQAEIVKYLKKEEIFHVVVHTQGIIVKNTNGQMFLAKNADLKGTPAIFCYLKKLKNTLWIEVKSCYGKLTPEQAAFRTRAQEEGMLFLLARSVTDVEKFLNSLSVQAT